MYVSWVLGDKLRIVMSSIMRWRRGEIGLVIGGLLSVGVHERAILADRTTPTDDPTPIGTANGPKGIYGRRSLSKPPKPTILDLSYRPHHKRLPRQRFSAMTDSHDRLWNDGGHGGSMWPLWLNAMKVPGRELGRDPGQMLRRGARAQGAAPAGAAGEMLRGDRRAIAHIC